MTASGLEPFCGHFGSEYAVITAEKVVLRYRTAGIGSRFLAWLVDLGLILVLLFAGVLLAGLLEALRGGLGQAVLQLVAFALLWGYFLLFEWLWSGQTPGKRLLGLRVIDDQGAALSAGQAVLRSLLRPIDALPLLLGPGLAGGVTALLDRHGRRLGDLAAATLVVHVERRGLARQAAAGVEQQDRGWQGEARPRLAALGRAQQQTLIELGLRRDQLRLAERARLFENVARFLRTSLGLSPEEYESDERFVLRITSLLSEGGT